jgi:hypothetical protein
MLFKIISDLFSILYLPMHKSYLQETVDHFLKIEYHQAWKPIIT